jgi:hypothetical protein
MFLLIYYQWKNHKKIFFISPVTMITKKELIRLSLLIILTRVLDGVTTYLSSPDLKREQNPIIKYFELGWIPVLVLGLIFIAFTLAMLVHGYKKQNMFSIEANGLKEFSSKYFYGKNLSLAEMLLKAPQKKATFVFICLVFPISLIYYSYFLILNNIFMYLTDLSDIALQVFMKTYFIYKPLYLVMIVFFSLFTSYQILKRKYKYHNKTIGTIKTI